DARPDKSHEFIGRNDRACALYKCNQDREGAAAELDSLVCQKQFSFVRYQPKAAEGVGSIGRSADLDRRSVALRGRRHSSLLRSSLAPAAGILTHTDGSYQ